MKTIIDELGKVSVTVEKEPWNDTKDYDKLTIVYHNFGTHISRKPVPVGKQLSDKEYWIPFSSLQEEVKIQFANLINTDEKHTNDINKLKIAVDNLTTAVDNLNIDIDITTLNTIKNQLSEHLLEYDSLNKDYQQYKEYATAEHAHINEKLENIDEVKDVVKQLKDSQYGFKVCNEIQSPGTTTSDSFKCNVHFVHFDRNGQTSTKEIKIPSATSNFAGLMSAADKTKLDTIVGNEVNSIIGIKQESHPGGIRLDMYKADGGIQNLDISTVNQNQAGILTVSRYNRIPWIIDGKIPTTYLPDHLDDIIEYDTKEDFPEEGKKGVLYVALDTNHFYRWSGSSYIDMSDVNGGTTVEFGETKGTAYEGDKGKKNADDIADINSTRVITNIDNRIVNADSIVLPVTGKQIDGADIVTSNITFPLANYNSAGLLSPSHKAKLDRLGIVPNLTNITITNTENGLNINYDSYNLNTGVTSEANINIPSATTTTAGVMAAADKVKLDNLVANSKTVEHFNIHVNTNNWSGFIEGNSGNKIAIGNTFRLIKSNTSPSNNGPLGYLLDTEYIISHYEGTSTAGVILAVGTCGQIELVVDDKATGAISEIRVDRSSDGHQYDVAKVLSTNDYTNDDKNTVTNLSNSLVKDITNTFSRTGGTLGFKVLTPNDGAYTDLNFSIPLASNAGNNGSGLISNVQYQKLESIPDVNTIVTTDSNGKIPNELLPSYVSDILEYSNKDAFPTTGTTGKIYVDIATNKTYRWSGTQYTLIGDGTGISVTGKLINATSGTATYERNSGTVNIPIKDASTSTESNFTIPLKGADETYAGLLAANDKKKLNGIIKNTHTLNASIDNESGATFIWQEQINDEANNWQATSNQFNIPIVSDTSAGLVTLDMISGGSTTDAIKNINIEVLKGENGYELQTATFDPNLGDILTITEVDTNNSSVENSLISGIYNIVSYFNTTGTIKTKAIGAKGEINIQKSTNTVSISFNPFTNNKIINATITGSNSTAYISVSENVSIGDILLVDNKFGGFPPIYNNKIIILGVVDSNNYNQGDYKYFGIAFTIVGPIHIYVKQDNQIDYKLIKNLIYGVSSNTNGNVIDYSFNGTKPNETVDVSLSITSAPNLNISNEIQLNGSTIDATSKNLFSDNSNSFVKCFVTRRLINNIIININEIKTKLNNFLTNTDATDEVISSWAEIQNFLDGIKDTDTLIGIKTSILNDAKSYVDNKNFITSSSLTKSSVGLGNVDNTSDLAKPVSTATQNALNNKVDKVVGKGLSTNDFTNALKTKLEGLSSSGSGNNYYIANIVNNKLVIGGNDIKNIISNGDAFYIEDEKVVSDTNVFQSNWIVVNIEGDSVNSYSIVALGNRGELLYTVNGGTPTWTINSSFVRKVSGKELSSNDYTNTDKSIISSLIEVGEVSSGIRSITTLADKVSINNAIYNFSDNDYNILSIDIPAASTTKAGVMTAEDKSKLDNLGNVKALTAAQYDALTTKDSNTIYFLTD